MDLGLKGKNVVITGGSKGIGFACAQAFVEEGANVALVARSVEGLKDAADRLAESALANGVKVTTWPTDLSSAAAVGDMAVQMFKDLGVVDVLVNCAGAARRTPALELTSDHWHAAMDSKFFPYIHTMSALLPDMLRLKSGAIINVIGMGGKIASPIHLPGGSANAALMLATAGLANAHAASGVRINAVNPGPVATDRLEEGLKAQARLSGVDVEAAREAQVSRLAIGRVAEPQEIANVVVFLASGKASYVTGATVQMDGSAVATVV